MNAKPTSKITDESTESLFEDQPADRLNEIKTSDAKSAPSESPVIEKEALKELIPAAPKIFKISRHPRDQGAFKREAAPVQRVQQPAEMMINNLCDKLKYPEMFVSRKLPRPATPPSKLGHVRVIENVSGITYDFRLKP